MRRLTLVISIVITFMFLIACGSTYRIGNESFSSASEALQRQTEIYSDIIREIKPNQNPVGGAALVIIPSDVEIQKNYNSLTYSSIKFSQEKLDFVNAARRNFLQFIADAIAKRRIFDSVSVARHNGNPASYPIGNSDFIIFSDVDGWFIKEKNKSLIIPIPLTFDKNKPEGVQLIARTEAFLDELHQQAQNLRVN